MSDITWRKGCDIPYGGKDERNRFVYIMTEDDGGYPSVTICYIHGEFRTETSDDLRWAAIAKSFDPNRDPEHFMRNYTPPLTPWIRIGNNGNEYGISNIHYEIVAWAECELPEIPDYSKLVE